MLSPGMRGIIGLAVCLGCEVSLNDISQWKDTERGPLKIRTALSDQEQPLNVRTAAAVALVDIGKLSELEQDLKTLPAEEQHAIVDAAVPQLMERMGGTNPKAPPSSAQARAKDAVFSLRVFASDVVHAKADASLVEWLTLDLPGRMLVGDHNAEKIIVAIGVSAAPMLARSLGPDTLDLVEPATLLRKVGDAASIDQGAQNLIELAKVSPREQTFLALARLGGPVATRFLNNVAQSGAPQVRLVALRALQVIADPSSIAIGRAVAADTRLSGELAVLRDEGFGILQQLAGKGDTSAQASLLTFLNDADEKVRWTAVDAICASKRPDFVAAMIERLPAWAVEKPADLKDFLEERIKKEMGQEILPLLRKLLVSENWVARLVAVRLIGDLGEKTDLPALEQLVREDHTPIRGWPDGATVGKEAQAAVARLRQRG